MPVCARLGDAELARDVADPAWLARRGQQFDQAQDQIDGVEIGRWRAGGFERCEH